MVLTFLAICSLTPTDERICFLKADSIVFNLPPVNWLPLTCVPCFSFLLTSPNLRSARNHISIILCIFIPSVELIKIHPMLKKYYKAIISLALSVVFGIFAYWYLNYYLIETTYHPDGTESGSIKEMTLTRSWILLGSILLSFSSFVLFLYHTVKTLRRTISNKT